MDCRGALCLPLYSIVVGPLLNDPRSNYQAIRERIVRAAESVGRDPDEITLVAVSKTHSVDAIRSLYDLGQRAFGENKLQEALSKFDLLPDDIEWHFIGKLQSNKARRVAERFHIIQTLENSGQLYEISKANRSVLGLIEVNIADEIQKSGLFVKDLDDFHEKLIQCKWIQFRGLMTVGPALNNPEEMRSYFARLRDLNERLGGKWLSMGMSSDFDVAIQEGATHVRVGTALFGNRDYSK